MNLRQRHLTAVPADITPISEALAMSHTQSPKPLGPNHDVPEEFEPSPQPVDPDEGTVPVYLPGDPGDDREIDPSAALDGPSRRQHGQAMPGGCP